MHRRAPSPAVNLLIAGCAAIVVFWSNAPRVNAADDLLARTRAMYGALRSYADSGTVVMETHHYVNKFTTYFNRAPRRFLLDVRYDTGVRFVIWGDPDAYHTWVAGGEQYDYPNPNNAPALSMTGYQTKGLTGKIPPLLYSKAQLGGDFTNLTDDVIEGTDVVGGRSCHRLAGTTRDVYAATGKEVNIRKITIWIDAESLLILKIVEQWKVLGGIPDRTTTTFEPQANATIDEAKFRFVAPTR